VALAARELVGIDAAWMVGRAVSTGEPSPEKILQAGSAARRKMAARISCFLDFIQWSFR
jgi:hypothetical protein